ncbi:hypothetical protein A2738_03185 [Candidatus Nomurabacteria bacterium RIFCSPHIGHO2_01_FULL_42_15]|uniref:DUF4190 domain-containing protein n=1 Tax=Candidatus Nomurabacteria bacterium RIFCSPHIGHO2_01_FULL_42_15 TaxID=1801742 RepID=A0A1F6VE52_9BACT|nr:MAG: hypothetical protein A2738_03185 [Candidatus Nomurabacteria bacterium RIFCSPHIGHO2_01_FULL_42_15]OGI92940.1 MAG: hypothetical protein A3A99_00130 [Candidatus Nomurabacteria bacterium RIFCSPLOWO2_01_FULL_41_18]
MKKKLVALSGVLFGLTPVLALAQGLSTTGATSGGCVLGQGSTIMGLLCRIGQILNAIVPVLIALGVVYFVWGVISYMIGGDEEAKKKGRDKIIYGIIGLAVIVAVWGLVGILTKTFEVDNNSRITLPTVPVVQ